MSIGYYSNKRKKVTEMTICHYYERKNGPFKNLSELSDEDACRVLADIKKNKPDCFIAKRPDDYIQKRRKYEAIMREEFIRMGGLVERDVPHYFVVERVPFMEKWYEEPMCLELPIEALDLRTVSFTYGDSHPTFSGNVKDGKEYRNNLYDYEGIQRLIEKYGLPQVWNPDFKYGPECYIEVQVWSNRGVCCC